jgi:hypothetical protein
MPDEAEVIPAFLKETTTVADDPDGMKTVTFLFEPKCLRADPPCRRVIAKMDCATSAATCP